MTNSLFRKEAVQHQTDRLWGDVLICIPLPAQVLTVFLSIIVLVIAMFLIFGSYARKQTVLGYLEPESGVSQVIAKQPGRVIQVYVAEDDRVEKDQLLATVSSTQYLEGGASAQGILLAEMEALVSQIDDQLTLEKQNGDREIERLQNQRADFSAERKSLLGQLEIVTKRVDILNEQSANAELLIEEEYVSKLELQRIQDAQLAALREAEQLEQLIIQTDSKLKGAESALDQLPLQLKQEISKLKSRQAELVLRRTELQARGTYSLKAPISGRISGLYVKNGLYVDSNALLISILPEDEKLQAILYVPTRAIGFIAKGQHTRLFYNAYPYQRFGSHAGEIVSVSSTVLMGPEVPSSAMTQEPVYKVTAALDDQSIKAFGKDYQLRAGMRLNAEIVLDERSLLEWVLEPLYSVKGRL